MKKTLVTASIISASLFLSACGETTETPVDSSAEETTTESAIEEAAPASPVRRTCSCFACRRTCRGTC